MIDPEEFDNLSEEEKREELMKLFDEFFRAISAVQIKHDECDKFVIDTAEIPEENYKYETAISHKDFNDGAWIILKRFNSKKRAIKFHEEIFEKYSKEEPEYIIEYSTATIYLKDR